MPIPTLNILPYSGWTQYTPVIPKLYWDVYSAEQRIKQLCLNFDKAEKYMDYVSQSMDDYSEEISEEVARELDEAHTALENLREELVKLIKETGEGSLDWDVQHGYYSSSIQAMRDMFNDVTVHSITLETLDTLDLNVEQLAECGLNVKGLAVLSYWLIEQFPIIDEYKYEPTGDENRLSVHDINRGLVTSDGFVYIPEDEEG